MNELLLERLKMGDKAAEDELVEENMGLVMSAAKKFTNRGYDFEELAQVGALGLIKAVKRFDTTYDVRFSTYAVPMIMGEIRRFLRDDGLIKISRKIKENAIKGWRTEEILRRELGREPTINEISQKSGITTEELLEAFDAAAYPESIYYEGEDSSHSERLSAPDNENIIINKLMIRTMLDKLEKRERQIIVLRYFKEKTQSQVAQIVGVSQVQVSRIEKRVLEKMKDMCTK